MGILWLSLAATPAALRLAGWIATATVWSARPGTSVPRLSRDSSPPYLLPEAVRRGWLPCLKGVTPAELIARIPQRLFPVRAA